MFDFGNANDGQRQAISTTEGPVLITAGPGTGKTYTLVQRAIYLIEERGVKPEDIFIATFTEKAAKELITRITNELASRNITVNVNEMYVGTFHSLCLRIIKEHLEYTRLKKNYRLLDTFDQQYLVFRNIYKFRMLSGIENVMPKGGAWKWAQAICEFSNNLTEEVVDIDAMLGDHDMEISVIAKVVNTYQAMLDEENLIDFSAIQTECYRLLTENKDILEDLRNSIKYIMVDEYQDTNYIQEQIIFLLGTHENICVVGDDDQGLYRFRGATIRNILEFPSKFDVGKCQIIPLVINYRSDSDIVEFYNKWMITTSGSKFKFEWDKFRYDKRIVANETSKIESPCVVKLASKDDEDEWHERVLDFINRLKNSGKIQDYNQLAFLFSSVKHERVISLARFLESNHINVYSPRSDMFFRREEVMQTLGCMMLMFPNYVKGLENGEYKFLDKDKRFCHNALVFAPDKTVLESLREIMTFDKTKVVPPEYARVLDANIKFHYLDESGTTLQTIDDSDFNIIISNNQKIIVKKKRKEDKPTDVLFGSGSLLADVYGDDDDSDVWDDATLMDNQRFKKLCRLPQLGVYVDEAHHLFGANLEKELRLGGANKTTLRNTINMLAEATSIVACYNYTGTPYVKRQVLPEVVYAYGLRDSISHGFLKDADPIGFDNVKNEEFLSMSPGCMKKEVLDLSFQPKKL